MTKIVLLDCDGPLVNDNTWHFFRFANEEKGYGWSYEDYCRVGRWQEITKLATSVTNVIYEEFVRSRSFPGYRPTGGAKEVLARVPVEGRIVCTSRSPELEGVTRDFLEEHYDGGFIGLHFGLYNKAATLRDRYDVGCLIDDNAHEIEQAAAAGVRAYLFPTRNFRHRNGVLKETLLEAESLVHGDMSDDEWEHVCCAAWEQLGDIMSVCLVD